MEYKVGQIKPYLSEKENKISKCKILEIIYEEFYLVEDLYTKEKIKIDENNIFLGDD